MRRLGRELLAQTSLDKVEAIANPASLADAAGVLTVTSTIPGAALGDIVECALDIDSEGLIVHGWVSAANTVKVQYQNETGGAVDLNGHNLHIRVKPWG